MNLLDLVWEALDRNDLERAEGLLDSILVREPKHVGALCLRADVFIRRRAFDSAFALLARALELEPSNPISHFTVGQAFRNTGNPEKAVPAYRRAAELAPGMFEAWYHLGLCLLQNHHETEAVSALGRSLELRPGYPPALHAMGDGYRVLLQIQKARECYEKALRGENEHTRGVLRIKLAMLVPPLCRLDEISSIRDRYRNEIAMLDQNPPRIEDPVAEVGCTYFFLSYHGLSDLELNVATARMFEKACPSLLYSAPHCGQPREPGRLRIGFISQNFRNHSIGRSSRGVISKLDPVRFEKTVYFFQEPKDEISRFIRDQAEHAVILTPSLEAARKRIAEDRLDILYYQDIGMDPLTYFLAFSRLATLQCVRHGHPDTTGIRNMDWWISCEGFEPEGAESHFSERLVKLRGIAAPTYYFCPEPPERLKTREDFGIEPGTHLYSCPQTLFKFHPDFDPMLAAILRGDPLGRLAVIEYRRESLTQALKQRFLHAMPDVINRVDFLPPMPHSDFMNVLALSDVVLDTPHFCGMNTSLQAFSLGAPVVTLPGLFQRSRHTASMYRQMGIDSCVAKNPNDYVDIALHLGLDPAFRSEVQAEIRARCGRLFEDPRVVLEFERVFLEAFEE